MLNIPEGTTRVVIRGRHAKSVQDGTNQTRTLTEKGAKLCAAVKDDYQSLIDYLISVFGPAVYACSEWPRSLLTTFLVTGAEHIVPDPRLTLKISVKKAPSPDPKFTDYYEWAKEQGHSINRLLCDLNANPNLFGDQPVDEALADNVDFLKSFEFENNLVITFDHEPVISLTAVKFGAANEDLGLKECQAFIFYLAISGQIIGVEKFAPPATLK